MRGGHAAPRGFRRQHQAPAAACFPPGRNRPGPAPDPDATVAFTPVWDDEPAVKPPAWAPGRGCVTLTRPADLSRLHRITAPEPAPPVPPRPDAGLSAAWVGRIRYPEPGTGASYAETLRLIGKATGTATTEELDSAWPPPALVAIGAEA